MNRREFLSLSAVSLYGAQQAQKPKPDESVTATATQQKTPRVGIVLSSFKGAEDHDGTKMAALADPRPPDADLTSTQIDAWVRKAIELGNTPTGGLPAIVSEEDWIVIKVNVAGCYGITAEMKGGGVYRPYVPGMVTDPRIVQSLIGFLTEKKLGGRISVVEGAEEWVAKDRSKLPTDGWTTDWGGAFGGVTYQGMIADFQKKYPSVKFDLFDLNYEETMEMPVPNDAMAKNNKAGTYHLAKTYLHCDKVISVAPLKTHSKLGVALSLANYLGLAPGGKYGFPKDKLYELGDLNEIVVDLYSYHPADYAILGGCFGIEGDGPSAPGGKSVHYNILLSGANGPAVDTIAAKIMGFDPDKLKYLALAEKKGFGGHDADVVWTRGNDPDEVKKEFRKPQGA